MNSTHKQYSRGFTLLEALVALLVMGFGMLALTSLQLSLSRNADVAKQRTEAMRLAQDKIEELRSYNGIDDGTSPWDNLASSSTAESISSYSIGTATVGTNTTFSRSWSLGGTNADQYRVAKVTVSWTDRANETQSIVLTTAIARNDPSLTGYANFPLPQNTNLKRPKNRNLNIPIQAIDLGDGRSAYRLNDGFQVIFSDTTGGVVRTCTGLDETGSNEADANCSNVDGYIVAGYVSGSITSSSGSDPSPTMPTGINTSGITGNTTGSTIKCIYQQATDVSASTTTYISGFHYYLCVIPVDVGSGWSGTIRLGGVSVLSSYKVCRFQYADSNFVDDNERNDGSYDNVQMSLDNQNYYISSSSGANCPSITSIATYYTSGDALEMHQDCRTTALPTVTQTGTCPSASFNAPSQ